MLPVSESPPSFSASASLRMVSRALRTSFFFMVFRLSCACSVSLLTLRGSVSLSTMPFRKFRYLQQHSHACAMRSRHHRSMQRKSKDNSLHRELELGQLQKVAEAVLSGVTCCGPL